MPGFDANPFGTSNGMLGELTATNSSPISSSGISSVLSELQGNTATPNQSSTSTIFGSPTNSFAGFIKGMLPSLFNTPGIGANMGTSTISAAQTISSLTVSRIITIVIGLLIFASGIFLLGRDHGE